MWYILIFFIQMVYADSFEFTLHSGQKISGKLMMSSSNCALIKSNSHYKAIHRNTIIDLSTINNSLSSSDILISDIFENNKYQSIDKGRDPQIAYTSIISSGLPYFILDERRKAIGYFIFEGVIGSLGLGLLIINQKGVFLSSMLSIFAIRYWVGSTTYKTQKGLNLQYNDVMYHFENYCQN